MWGLLSSQKASVRVGGEGRWSSGESWGVTSLVHQLLNYHCPTALLGDGTPLYTLDLATFSGDYNTNVECELYCIYKEYHIRHIRCALVYCAHPQLCGQNKEVCSTGRTRGLAFPFMSDIWSPCGVFRVKCGSYRIYSKKSHSILQLGEAFIGRWHLVDGGDY